MNYTTSIAYNTRNGDFEQPEGFKFITIKETYIKVFAVMVSLCCAAGVLYLNSL
ncbi:MAG: hypothetical protein KDC07_00860 [Chitinophagaceae bacterium]|nr:hypothetical protein [Chitinophagaceae bacterium]MCB9045521.1 hypothetical protein [Chitinophagales bacterium]